MIGRLDELGYLPFTYRPAFVRRDLHIEDIIDRESV